MRHHSRLVWIVLLRALWAHAEQAPTALRPSEIQVRDGMLTVKRGARHNEAVDYMITGRNLATTRSQKHFPDRLLDPEEMKRRGPVLDVGCGKGALVRDLLSAGVDAYGMDLHLIDELKSDSKHFVEADAANGDGKNEEKGLTSGKFGTVYSVISVYSYETQNHDLMVASLLESRRLLKVGGVLRISPIFRTDVPLMKEYLREVPGLTLSEIGDTERHDMVYLTSQKQAPAISPGRASPSPSPGKPRR